MIKFLFWLLVCLISTFGYTYFYFLLNELKFSFNLKLIIIFIIAVLCITFLKYYQTPLNSLAYFIFFPIIFYTIDKCGFKKLIFYIFVIWLCGILLDFSSMLIVSLLYYIFGVDVNNSIYMMVPTILVCVMLLFLGKNKFFRKIINLLFKTINKIKYADFMLTIFSIFIFVVGMVLAINIRHINIGVMACIVALLTIIIFALLLRTKYNEIENNIFIEILRKNNDFYISMDKEQNIFKHNLISKLLSVKSVSNKESRLLIEDLIKEFNSNIDYSRKIEDIPYGLDGIINEKIYPYSDDIEIKVDNKIEVDIFDVLKPRRYNVLVEKLSLILDNAVEASLNSADKILVINLYEENNQIFIEVKNSFSGIMNVDDLGKVNYSSKDKRRGFGLYSALRNNEVYLTVKVINNLFIAKLTVNKNLNIE